MRFQDPTPMKKKCGGVVLPNNPVTGIVKRFDELLGGHPRQDRLTNMSTVDKIVNDCSGRLT